MYHKIQETVTYLKAQTNIQPETGIILGSGLGGMEDALESKTEIPYATIPNFPKSTVEGHAGKLIFGKMHGKAVVMMAGRFHYYEGYDMQTVTFPVRIMKALGTTSLIVSNAAGGMNDGFQIGDIMLIKDHINLFPEHPLRGPNDDRLGIRFPDMSAPYDPMLLEQAKAIARAQNFTVREGIYVGLQGPTFETRAEYKWLRIIGGDAVGMSTVPEVIVARHCGLKVFAASIITDLGLPDMPVKITHQEVLEAAHKATPKLMFLISELVKKM